MDAEVTIVGAGLAGLTAAHHLAAAGRTVTVLEAGDAVGGRVRTEHVDGYLLDRGFQVFNTAYPEPARVLDIEALHLRPFTPGALLMRAGGRHRVGNPLRSPLSLAATVTAPLGPLPGRLALAALSAKIATLPVDRLLAHPETTTGRYLRDAGVSVEVVEGFLRPFLSGVFLERELTTSSRLFALVWRCFLRGTSALPEAGIGEIPAQLARGLPPGSVLVKRPVDTLDELRAGSPVVLVATDPATAHALLPELGPAPAMTSVTTFYHSCAEPPVGEPVLCLDGESRSPITNAVELTAAAPSYAPPGRHLVATSVLGTEVDEPTVRAGLRDWFGAAVAEWELVETVRLGQATPRQTPPLGCLRRPVRARPGVFVAGDHRDTASVQGACVSGRRAAAAILKELR
jgi:phytoene dehydrogenase-like protein